MTTSAAYSPDNLVWIDMEMTGLDPETCVVLEIATIVTDSQLNVLAEGPVIAVHQPDAVLDGMDEWCTRVHGESGLTQRCRESSIDEATAAKQTIAFLEQYVPAGIASVRKHYWSGSPLYGEVHGRAGGILPLSQC